jgi:hypothetical protein
MDYDPILHFKTRKIEEVKELKNENLDDLFYISNKIIIDKGMLYPSEYAWKNMLAVKETEDFSKFSSDTDLMRDLPFLRILKRTR